MTILRINVTQKLDFITKHDLAESAQTRQNKSLGIADTRLNSSSVNIIIFTTQSTKR